MLGPTSMKKSFMATKSQTHAPLASPAIKPERAGIRADAEFVRNGRRDEQEYAVSGFHEFISSFHSPRRIAGTSIRTAVVFAHPDDECVGLGALLPDLGDPWLVCVTDG